MARKSTWDGVERRSGEDRRSGNDRRAEARTAWERRCGHDRRGHKLYAALLELRAQRESVEQEELSDTG